MDLPIPITKYTKPVVLFAVYHKLAGNTHHYKLFYGKSASSVDYELLGFYVVGSSTYALFCG